MILLDTHVLYWAVCEPSRLSRDAARAIEKARASDGFAIASVTLFELAALFRSGRIIATSGHLSVTAAVEIIISAARPRILDITVEIAAAATEFPHTFSHDPMDRLIAATARVEGLSLVTKDQRMQDCPHLKTIW